MRHNLKHPTGLKEAKERFSKLIEKGAIIELTEVSNSRTTQQNRALHLYFTMIAEQLNELGLQYQYTSIVGEIFELRYTTELVKEYVWRPLQVALFKIERTKKINTQQINEIIDVITLFFSERGVDLRFPNIDYLMEMYNDEKQ